MKIVSIWFLQFWYLILQLFWQSGNDLSFFFYVNIYIKLKSSNIVFIPPLPTPNQTSTPQKERMTIHVCYYILKVIVLYIFISDNLC